METASDLTLKLHNSGTDPRVGYSYTLQLKINTEHTFLMLILSVSPETI
jgi:hypothetical protein